MYTVLSSRITNMSPQLLISDIEKSIEFYTEHLGFEVRFRYKDFYAGIAKDRYIIHLKSADKANINRKQKRTDDLDIIFSVDGIENMYATILNQPVNIKQTLRKMPYGNEFYINDPDGNAIAFLEENEHKY